MQWHLRGMIATKGITMYHNVLTRKLQNGVVENSWDAKGIQSGYYAMSQDWFKEYVYEVVVNKKYLTTETTRKYWNHPKKQKIYHHGIRWDHWHKKFFCLQYQYN